MYRGVSQSISPWQSSRNTLYTSKECHSKTVNTVPLSKTRGRFFFEDYLRESSQPLAGPHRGVRGSMRQETEEDVEVRIQRVEGVLFISRESLTTRRLAHLAGLADATEARTLIRRLNERYEKVGRAFRIEEVGGGFEMLTKPQFAPWLRRLGHVPPEERLTAAAMEVLAIIAYRQPVMRADIEAIRGVSSEEVLKQLLSRDLVRICGRSEELGRPYLYGTTKRFLKMFGLKSLEKLPRANWINETWDVEELPDDRSGIQAGGSDPGLPTLFSSQSMNNNGLNRNRASSETSQGLQELQDLVDNRISENENRTDSNVSDSKVNSVDLQPGTDTKESIVKLANSAIGLAFESEENLEEQLAVASRLASIPVAVDEDEDEDFEDDDEEYEDEEDDDFEDYEDEDDEDLDEDLDEDFEDEEESDDDESFEDEDEDEWEEVEEEEDEAEEDEEDEDWDDEDDDDWDDDDEEEEEEEDWE